MSKLIDYLIPEIRKTEEYQQLTKAEQPEVDLIQSRLAEVYTESLINLATRETIEKWESYFNLDSTLTMEERRMNVLLTLTCRTTINVAWLNERLDNFFGQGNYEYEINGYTLTIRIARAKQNLARKFVEEIRYVIPCNMALELIGPEEYASSIHVGAFTRTKDTIVFNIGEIEIVNLPTNINKTVNVGAFVRTYDRREL